jgi:hypothetical protein
VFSLVNEVRPPPKLYSCTVVVLGFTVWAERVKQELLNKTAEIAKNARRPLVVLIAFFLNRQRLWIAIKGFS